MTTLNLNSYGLWVVTITRLDSNGLQVRQYKFNVEVDARRFMATVE